VTKDSASEGGGFRESIDLLGMEPNSDSLRSEHPMTAVFRNMELIMGDEIT
jgi:hypothetical protein